MVAWSLTKVGREERKLLLLVSAFLITALRLILLAVVCVTPCSLRRPSFPTSQLSLFLCPFAHICKFCTTLFLMTGHKAKKLMAEMEASSGRSRGRRRASAKPASSQTALSVQDLQVKLPTARVVYGTSLF